MHLGFIVQAADISIHALREEGDFRLCAAFSSPPISIHALREEGDVRFGRRASHGSDFYPRPPRGGRPTCICWTASRSSISIHALREEGDSGW